MGVVKRQSFKKSIVRYTGVLIGMVSLLFIYPMAGNMVGEFRFIVNTASLLVPFFLLGVNSWAVRFYPTFLNKENGNNGFLGFLLLSGLLTFSLVAGVVIFFQDQIIDFLAYHLDRSPSELIENKNLIFILTFLLCMILTLIPYISNFNRIVVPDILFNFSLKIVYPVLILLFYYSMISRMDVKMGVIVSHVVILIGLLIYIKSLGQLKMKINFSFLDRPLLKTMVTYALFGVIGTIGSILATRIDIFMVTTYSKESYDGTWVYDFAVQVINVVAIPYTAFVSIGAPLIAQAMNRNDINEVGNTYRRSSIILLIASLGLFLATWISVDQLFLLTKRLEEIKGAKYIIFFLGVGNIVDMVTGLNSHIINYSKYFRFNAIAVIALGIFNIFTNLYFIPIYGITGAAIATFASLTLFNLLKLIFIWVKFGIQPFTLATLQVLLFAGVAFGVAYIIPYMGIPILDIAIHSGIFAMLFAFLVLYFKVSADVNELFEEALSRVRKLLP